MLSLELILRWLSLYFLVATDRDISITSAVVQLSPIFAMVELDSLVTAAENKGAVGQLLSMLPRYARVVQERQRAFVCDGERS